MKTIDDWNALLKEKFPDQNIHIQQEDNIWYVYNGDRKLRTQWERLSPESLPDVLANKMEEALIISVVNAISKELNNEPFLKTKKSIPEKEKKVKTTKPRKKKSEEPPGEEV